MKFDIVEIKKDDTILSPIYIGSIPPSDVDKYCQKHLKTLKETFGCKVAIFPSRTIKNFDFTIIRKSKTR